MGYAAVDGVEAPLEVLKASLEVLVSLVVQKGLTEVQDCQEAPVVASAEAVRQEA